MQRSHVIAAIICAAVLGACSTGGSDGSAASTTPDSQEVVRDRIEELQTAVSAWSAAASIDDAQQAAERAINLVVGPNGPGYGDRNNDGQIAGASQAGLLSGLDGTPPGLAVALQDNDCVRRDVLGSTADDPAGGWAEMQTAIGVWRPDNNSMPTLLSHPMRIVGWSTFTLAATDLGVALEYAGHAQLHVNVARAALDC